VAVLVHPSAGHDQDCAEDTGEHAGIFPGFDIAENAADEAANAAKYSDGEKYDASQNQDVGDWCVG